MTIHMNSDGEHAAGPPQADAFGEDFDDASQFATLDLGAVPAGRV